MPLGELDILLLIAEEGAVHEEKQRRLSEQKRAVR